MIKIELFIAQWRRYDWVQEKPYDDWEIVTSKKGTVKFFENYSDAENAAQAKALNAGTPKPKECARVIRVFLNGEVA